MHLETLTTASGRQDGQSGYLKVPTKYPVCHDENQKQRYHDHDMFLVLALVRAIFASQLDSCYDVPLPPGGKCAVHEHEREDAHAVRMDSLP